MIGKVASPRELAHVTRAFVGAIHFEIHATTPILKGSKAVAVTNQTCHGRPRPKRLQNAASSGLTVPPDD
jgi:hypothetical protein